MSAAIMEHKRAELAKLQALHLDELFGRFNPLVPPSEAAFLLGCSNEAVGYRLEEGRLRAINIAAEGEAADRRELRFCLYSVAHLLLRPHLPLQILPPETILPHGRACFMRQEIASLLSCTPRHVGNLRALQGASISPRLPNVARPALVKFIEAREVKP